MMILHAKETAESVCLLIDTTSIKNNSVKLDHLTKHNKLQHTREDVTIIEDNPIIFLSNDHIFKRNVRDKIFHYFLCAIR